MLPTSAAAESTCDSAILAALIFARGLDALGQTIAEVGGELLDAERGSTRRGQFDRQR